jgi:F-type H+-transporting ATPase subunit a
MANQPAIDPMEQFVIHKLVDLPTFHVGKLAVDMSINTSVMTMLVGAVLIVAFFALTARREIVPNRGQAVAEALYNIIDRVLVGPILGPHGRPYVPYLFTLFIVILTLNLMSVVFAVGNIAGQSWTFAVTSQIAVTATLALLTFLSVFILGFIKHGPKFVSLFWVPGMGIFGGPLPLALRLFGNMLGGHVVMSLFGSFVVALAIVGLSGGIATLAFIPSVLSFTMIVALTGLELVVAVLQAFVFAALATVYLNEVVNFGHGH